mmetsp:Transcript_38080/g.52893  ORF Transcript_38080/g.52893 Transcript_38080/m.52893 type:complete len:101 (+) Transcript_38080:514-816(+)
MITGGQSEGVGVVIIVWNRDLEGGMDRADIESEFFVGPRRRGELVEAAGARVTEDGVEAFVTSFLFGGPLDGRGGGVLRGDVEEEGNEEEAENFKPKEGG